MKNQTYRMTMLFDFYGEILTERQKEFFDLYYNEDLSLGEIAENYGISRQGVRDVIVRAEAAMQGIEDKTGLIRRFMLMQPKITAIEEAASLASAPASMSMRLARFRLSRFCCSLCAVGAALPLPVSSPSTLV